ncbi:MAG: DUF4783 domain-containing protein [Chitinophagaceae bacterium]|nr:DUF4783 domain-containing protein [Chitinophagaceae bacterium]MCW5929126.1 DUF4783 domain-containing protein [Chitinophagaceae bacterium]
MNRFFHNIALVCCFTTLFSFIPFSNSIDDVAGAMKSGNADMLSRYFDNMVEITLHERSHAYSRSQAETIIRDFFKCYGVKSFKIVNRGSSNGTDFCIGDLETRHGEFRTTIFMKYRSQKQVLQELRFVGKK